MFENQNRLPESKLVSLDSDSDGLNLLHKISQHKLNTPKFNELRPFLLVDNCEFQQDKLNVCSFYFVSYLILLNVY